MSSKSFVKQGFVWTAAAIAAVGAGLLIGAGGQPARAAEAQTYFVQVGAGGPANTDLLQFAPGALTVHRGDTVTWVNNGFHNIRVGGTEPVPFVIAPEVDGKPLPQVNPQVAFPNGAKSGEKFSGGEANSGLPSPDAPPIFSLVIDLEPGTTVAYLCDVHPGMAGSLTVAADADAIPSPDQVALQASAELGASVGAAIANANQTEAASMSNMSEGTIQVGADIGRAAGLLYYPFVTTVKVGTPVTWTIPATNIEPHTVSWPPVRGQDVSPMPQEGKPPILMLGPSIAPMTQSGATIKAGEVFSSGLFMPGMSFTLTFSEPGTYPYTCNIHPGMNGVVVVEAN